MEILDYFAVEYGTDYFFKTISIRSSGSDLTFEGLGSRVFQANWIFCHRFLGVNPQRSDHRGFSGIFSEISS